MVFIHVIVHVVIKFQGGGICQGGYLEVPPLYNTVARMRMSHMMVFVFGEKLAIPRGLNWRLLQ